MGCDKEINEGEHWMLSNKRFHFSTFFVSGKSFSYQHDYLNDASHYQKEKRHEKPRRIKAAIKVF